MSAHAPLPPSGAPAWGICSGSIMANMGAPDIETPQKREGTAGHWVFSESLLTYTTPGASPVPCAQFVGKIAPNGVVIDQRMADGAEQIVRDILRVANEFGALQSVLNEHIVHMPHIHQDNWGTLDCAIPLQQMNRVYLWDYKAGHRECNARGNLQLVDYSEGLAAEIPWINHDTQFHFRIVQPFSHKATGVIDEWVVTGAELAPLLRQLRARANEAYANPTMTAGKHCRDCHAIGRCSTAKRAGYSLFDYVNEPYAIDTMSGADLAVERILLQDGFALIKARLQAIDDDLEHRISNGAKDTGLSLGSKPGAPQWIVPVEQAIAFAAQFNTDISKPGTMTPTQAKSAVPSEMRLMFEQVLSTVTQRAAGSLKLIPAGDTVAARAFKRK